MSAEQEGHRRSESPLADWIKQSQELWTNWMRAAAQTREARDPEDRPPGKTEAGAGRGRMQENWETAFRMWQQRFSGQDQMLLLEDYFLDLEL